ncbi:hypothetical protein HYH02_007119 [Chlamydomonas schloesseri]|uniref:EamA domain-containing protein n=1 Tax=Chlamydomonas schloesseri TaxID=2026947 RepID=A0A835WJP5_9CHLO|nr:hypothetical protein HYH02_007119 [Chlamydomonas schloesseri]|eukprot:KAG2448095.1 hypothetical protein HYH02_007119 [Chlamydomonas schloesseri]
MARLRVLVLAGFMLFFGTINTLTTKFQDMTVVGVGPDGKPRTFNHPAVQSFFMFFGELLCLVPHFVGEWRLAGSRSRVKRRQELARRGAAFRVRRVLAFAAPACCDCVATTLLNVGLFYTYASTYQMLRGTLVLFAGFFTVTVLRRRLYIHHWLGMVLITGGAALVGAASVLSTHHGGSSGGGGPSPSPAAAPGLAAEGDGGGAAGGLLLGFQRLALAALGGGPGVDAAAAPLFGDLCVVAAQAFTALQFILEEKFVAVYKVPTLLAVGLEGAWGCAVAAVALPLLEAVRVGPGGTSLDSAAQAFREVVAHGPLAASVGVTVVSIGFFNFFGISVTKALSGAARATIDACRTLFVWLASLALGWEHFLPLQVVGFAVLFSGTSLYNELIRICLPTPEVEEEEAALLEGGGSGSASGSGSESDGEGEGEDGYGSGTGGGGGGGRNAASAAAAALWRAAGGGKDVEGGIGLNEPLLQPSAAALGRAGSSGSPIKAITSIAAAAGATATSSGYGPIGASVPPPAAAAAAAGAQAAAAAPAQAVAARGGGRRHGGRGRDSSDSEYTMARSMRLGQSTLLPHALDADTDHEPGGGDSDTVGGSSPGGLSYTAGSAAAAGGGLLASHPNIPEGDEEGDLVGCMSGIDVPQSPRNVARGSQGAPGGGGGGGQRVSIAIGPHGMLSGGVGRGGVSGGGGDGGGGGGGGTGAVPIMQPSARRK